VSVKLSWPFVLGRKRIIVCGAVLLVFQIFLLGFLVAGSYGLVRQRGPSAVSFVSFYAAGELADAGHPAGAYDKGTLYQAELSLTGRNIRYIPFLYPPVYLLLCSALPLLPALAAAIVFEAITLVGFLAVVKQILRVRGLAWLVPALAFPPTFWTLGYGQNSFLTAALLGAGTLLVDRRPAIGGALFWMLVFKPQFALLVSAALFAGRHWRAIGGAAASAILLVLLSIALFGIDTWHVYIIQFLGSKETYDFETDSANIFGMTTPFAAARLFGLSPARARMVQLAASLIAVVLVVWVWKKEASPASRGSVLAAATLIATPYALLYDSMIGAISAAWLLRAGRDSGFRPGEVAALAAAYLLPLFAFQAALATRWPLAPIASGILLWLSVSRAWQERAMSQAAPRP
jgi:hypothetical protein